MSSGELIYEKRGRIAYITINCPERMNAMTAEVHDRLTQAWYDVAADPEVWVAIVTGSGEKAFCTGMDLKNTAETGGPAARETPRQLKGHIKTTALHCGVWKPVIAAVNGMAVGGGLHLVVGSDIAIAAEHATFIDTHVSVGQVAALEPIGLLKKGVPMSTVMRMVLLGRYERLSAQQALEAGIISQVVAADQLMDAATELAEKMCRNSLSAMMRSKRALWESTLYGEEEALQNGWELLIDHWKHPDFMEGPKAFMEKRAANWDTSTLPF